MGVAGLMTSMIKMHPNPFVLSLSKHAREDSAVRALRQAQRERETAKAADRC
jgi:hypothetical protein